MKRIYKPEDLQEIFEQDFLLDPSTFEQGKTKADVVDSLCICHCLDREWTEFFAKWVDNFTIEYDGKEYINHLQRTPEHHEYGTALVPPLEWEINHILSYYEDYKDYFVTNELLGKARWGRVGTMDAMDYCINY